MFQGAARQRPCNGRRSELLVSCHRNLQEPPRLCDVAQSRVYSGLTPRCSKVSEDAIDVVVEVLRVVTDPISPHSGPIIAEMVAQGYACSGAPTSASLKQGQCQKDQQISPSI